LWMLIVHDA